MRHPTEGTLRRLVDEPAGVSDSDREHVASCVACRRALDDVRADARVVDAALAPVTTGVDLDAAWVRLTTTDPAEQRQAAPRRSWRAAVRRPAVAAISAVVLVTGAGVAAANDWLPIFQTESVDPVEVTTADLVQLPDLSAYGDLEVTQEPDTVEVPDAATARERTGLAVPEVAELPEGVSGDPTYRVAGTISAIFTFSAETAAQAAAAEGEDLPAPPPGVDGSSLRLQAGPGVAAFWSQPTGVPTLVVARVGAPTVDASGGVEFDTVRDYLLSLPGLPPGLAAQLRDLSDDDDGTLPLPVPAELVTTSAADVNGADATVLTSRNGLFAGVVWVEDGVMTGVAGTLSADELLSVARGLR
ncbi:hypothetical protein [Blastococcus sp. CT_GayMR16]|uniref:hypothetical protein n=1 Tax=Blastococcus sp. CT_GayMR16 TaxID=2559607 RepID=UPI001073201B|nr:hypothetical protein [Blastococcus sp. CT_GayMR16]TFV91346.1 hypothetical protein E4P38_01775 [Blastococcus sp. CT_GayMR16]